MHTSLMSLSNGAVQPPLPLAGEGRGGGEKNEDKSLVFLILNTPFLTFPRKREKGAIGNGYLLQGNGVGTRCCWKRANFRTCVHKNVR
jgi:hypothetical protein